MTRVSDIGTGLVAARLASGITQRELGEKLGVSQPQIARWEASSYRSASLSRVDAAALALGLGLETAGAPLAAESAAAYAPAAPVAAETGARALQRLGVSPETIAAFCRLHGIAELALFGSSVRRDFSAQSDVDVLVTWKDGVPAPTADRVADIQTELAGIFRRSVDLFDRGSIDRSENYIRRDRILEGARTVYVAR
jgi:predicted nucleotidyltransferase